MILEDPGCNQFIPLCAFWQIKQWIKVQNRLVFMHAHYINCKSDIRLTHFPGRHGRYQSHIIINSPSKQNQLFSIGWEGSQIHFSFDNTDFVRRQRQQPAKLAWRRLAGDIFRWKSCVRVCSHCTLPNILFRKVISWLLEIKSRRRIFPRNILYTYILFFSFIFALSGFKVENICWREKEEAIEMFCYFFPPHHF